MRFSFLYFLLMFGWTSTFGQSAERISVKGTIIVPEGFDPGGITIYNGTSKKGEISSEKGDFSLGMAEGDSLFFTALQFKELKLAVDPATINSGRLKVRIIEGINELPEIIINEHSLTGDMDRDAKEIPVLRTGLSSVPATEINEYAWEWRPDSRTSPQNAAMQKPGEGANLLGLAGALVNLLLPNRRSKERKKIFLPKGTSGKAIMVRGVRTQYNDLFFIEDIGLPAREISDFLSFCMENGFDRDLLNKGKELDLIQFFMDQKKKYDLQVRK